MECLCRNRRPSSLTKETYLARIPILSRKESVCRVVARIAQLVEQLALNQTVGGSNPSARTAIALVAQWIEQGSSKALMLVRFQPRAQALRARILSWKKTQEKSHKFRVVTIVQW